MPADCAAPVVDAPAAPMAPAAGWPEAVADHPASEAGRLLELLARSTELRAQAETMGYDPTDVNVWLGQATYEQSVDLIDEVMAFMPTAPDEAALKVQALVHYLSCNDGSLFSWDEDGAEERSLVATARILRENAGPISAWNLTMAPRGTGAVVIPPAVHDALATLLTELDEAFTAYDEGFLKAAYAVQDSGAAVDEPRAKAAFERHCRAWEAVLDYEAQNLEELGRKVAIFMPHAAGDVARAKASLSRDLDRLMDLAGGAADEVTPEGDDQDIREMADIQWDAEPDAEKLNGPKFLELAREHAASFHFASAILATNKPGVVDQVRRMQDIDDGVPLYVRLQRGLSETADWLSKGAKLIVAAESRLMCAAAVIVLEPEPDAT